MVQDQAAKQCFLMVVNDSVKITSPISAICVIKQCVSQLENFLCCSRASPGLDVEKGPLQFLQGASFSGTTNTKVVWDTF